MKQLITGVEKLGLQLTSRQVEQFSTCYQELIKWNRRMNLTTITDYQEVQIKHFLDSLTITLAVKQPIDNMRVIDVGTGAGLPGIPLKITFPDIRLVLLEATAKKVTFLQHLKKKLELDNVEIIVGRAEEVAHLSEYRERFDIVLSRAVAPLPTLAEVTLPFCTVDGSVIAQKKGDVRPDINPNFILYYLDKILEMAKDENLMRLYKSPPDLINELTRFFFYGILPRGKNSTVNQ